MTEYKGTKGGAVQNFEEDPGNPYVGQVWYNETLGNLRVRATTLTSAWASGGNLNTARHNLRGAGTQTAGLAFGGGHTVVTALTEQYDGSSWTEVNDLNTARSSLGGDGTQTSALAFGGQPVTAVTESWNGTNWTEVNDLNTARDALRGVAANNTVALAFGGQLPPGSLANTELWNGTNWTEVNDLNTARRNMAAAGIYTAALSAGGGPPAVANVESWNGTNWTNENNMNSFIGY